MRRNIFFTIVFVLSTFVCFPLIATAQNVVSSEFDTRIDALSKRDPQIKQLPEWEALAADISANVEAGSGNSPTLLFQLGKLHERIFRSRESRASLLRAVEAYERLARDYSGNALADDALLALGDLRRDGLQDDVAARAAYFEIIDRYSRGNVVGTAKARIAPPAPVSPEISAVKTETKTVSIAQAITASTTTSSTLSRAFQPTGNRSREVFSRHDETKRPLVVIDAGHGGDDLGAHGPDGILEKEIVLSVAEYLDELLRDRLRARTVLTRSRDTFIPLPERTQIANEKNADLFISIHANASEFKTASGIETYYLDNTNNKSSLKLAERENMSLQMGGGGGASDLGFILSDLIQNVKLDDSISLAHKLQDSLWQTLGRYYDGVNNLGVKKAPFYVLVGAHMPCVLVEISFIDHPVEGRRLADRKYQKLVALALFQGIRDFFTPREERR